MTKADFLNLLLRNIGRISVGQSASPSDVASTTAIYKSVYEQAQEEGLVSWGISEGVPDWAVMPLKKVVSPDLAREFGLTEKRIEAFQREYSSGMRALIRNVNQDHQPGITTAEYF